MKDNFSILEKVARRISYETNSLILCELAKEILTLQKRFVNIRMNEVKGFTW